MCKLEEYGNCDEETKDQEYCIFHKPNKNEEEAREFYEKFLRRFRPKKERITLEEIERERFVFEETVDCRGYVFPEIPKDMEFSFVYSVFKGNAGFDRATFKGDAWFFRVTFEGDAWFFRAIFEGDAVFLEATFEGDAVFGETTFEGFAWFGEATFEGDAVFDRATFKGDTWFEGATFEGYAQFGGATFEGIVTFKGKRKDSKYKFYGKLGFSNTEFRKGVLIDIPSEWFKLPSAKAEAYRVQRISYEREGKKDDADRMFVRERRALREAKVEKAKDDVEKTKEELKRFIDSQKAEGIKAKLKSLFKLIKAIGNYLLAEFGSFLEFLLADWTCEYGTNWRRPVILWMLFVFLVFPLLYFILGGITKVSSPLDYLYFSVVTATTFGYGDLQPIGWCRLVASMEAIFGTFMWAVFLVVFARKYMR